MTLFVQIPSSSLPLDEFDPGPSLDLPGHVRLQPLWHPLPRDHVEVGHEADDGDLDLQEGVAHPDAVAGALTEGQEGVRVPERMLSVGFWFFYYHTTHLEYM